MSYPAAQKLAEHLKLSKAKDKIRVLDLAAGSGIWGIALTQKSPRVRVTAVDWAGMIPTTKRITQKFGVGDSLQQVALDTSKPIDYAELLCTSFRRHNYCCRTYLSVLHTGRVLCMGNLPTA